jgi:hypothetical protein
MPNVTIDGKEYDLESLSEEAKNQLTSIQFVDRKIAELQAELAVCQTARNTYAKTLSDMLVKSQ